MKILTEPAFLTGIDLAAVEEKYNARYVCETTLKNRYGWRYEPSLIFWTPTPHPEGSNYFALSTQDGTCFISNGISATADPIVGIRANNGDVIYSRYRHDYRTSADGSVFIDGGREYFRCADPSRLVELVFDKDELIVKENEHDTTSESNG